MKIEPRKRLMANTVDELAESVNLAIEELNGTKEANCWVCGEPVSNWGMIVPNDNPGGLGFGTPTKEQGKEVVRVAFFPFCPHHNMDDEKNMRKVEEKILSMRQQLLN